MFTYTVSLNADREIFRRTCLEIEKYREIKRKELIEDVDGSQIAVFEASDGIIKVFNDYEVDAVYVDSEIDLKDCKIWG